MSKKTQIITKDYLINAPLPLKTSSYTPITHEFIINESLKLLSNNGFQVESEMYRCNINAEIASGRYNITFEGDSEMGMMFTWVNSYNKMLKFSCAIGGRMYINNSSIVSNKMSSFSRKHTGLADIEAGKEITSQIENAYLYYNQLVSDKNNMKNIILTKREMAELTGRLYIEKKLITAEQTGIVRSEITKPSFVYEGEKSSLWEFYNHIIYALQGSHPKNWLDQQRLTHWFICEHFGIDPMSIISSVGQPLEEMIAPMDVAAIVPEEDLKPGDQISIEHVPGIIEETVIVPLMSAQLGTMDLSKPEEGFIPNEEELPLLVEYKEVSSKEVFEEYKDDLTSEQKSEIVSRFDDAIKADEEADMMKVDTMSIKEIEEIVQLDNADLPVSKSLSSFDSKILSLSNFNQLVDLHKLLLTNGLDGTFQISINGSKEFVGECSIDLKTGLLKYTHYK